jgi:thioredoxin reductase
MRPLKNLSEIAVIGGGLAGLSAARHAARLGRFVTLFEASGFFGGLVATIDEVDGLPVPGKFSGQDLAIHLLQDARKAAVRVVDRSVAKIEFGTRLTLIDEADSIYHPEAIIVASGASLRKLGIPGEEEFVGKGVSRCATCDGGFFRGQDVVVVGGGDSAAQEALLLARTSRRVIMVCRSPMKAKRDYVDRLAARENVTFMWDNEGERGSRRRWGYRRAPTQCADRRELGRRMHRCVSLHRGFAEYHVRACIGSDGNGPHRDDIGSCDLRSSRFCRGCGSGAIWW